MTKTIYVSVAVAALLAVGKAAMPYFPHNEKMNCQQCIVSGYDFCLDGTSDGKTPKRGEANCY